MFLYPTKVLKSSKGISVITVIILLAIVVGAFNAYAYFNPKFQLSRFSVFYLLRYQQDKQRKADLEKIHSILDKYYDDKGDYPGSDGWCGRIVTILHPEVNEAILSYFGDKGIPQDPVYKGTNKDYFYRREDERTFILMAVLDNSPASSPTYNYSGCFDWPGDGVYNYKIEVSR